MGLPAERRLHRNGQPLGMLLCMALMEVVCPVAVAGARTLPADGAASLDTMVVEGPIR